MNPEIKALWLEALRSGEYKQGQHRLRGEVYSEDGTLEFYEYCCLGVLCDLYSKAKGLDWPEGGSHLGNHSFPGSLVGEWAGLAHAERIGEFGDIDNEYVDVAAMNDSGKSSFKEIADVLERLA